MLNDESRAFGCGLVAGFATTVILHPLDLIKTRFQVDESVRKYSFTQRWRYRFQKSMATVADQSLTTNAIRKELGFLGLYRGVVPAMIGSSASWGIYFLLYERLKKERMNATSRALDDNDVDSIKNKNGKGNNRLKPWEYLAASTIAGTITTFCTNPVWLIKTRMELQGPGRERYHGFIHAIRTIVKEEGLLGLYKGIVPALFLVSNGAIQFMVYEELKLFVDGPLTPVDYMLMGALSKSVASTITYPYQVIKSRMQQHGSKYHSMWFTIREMTKRQGFLAFYQGLFPNLLRVMPASAITFATYELTNKFLKG